MTQRDKIKAYLWQKYNGRCAYCGKPLESDWQIDHIKPVLRNMYSGEMLYPDRDSLDNLLPAIKIVNHYKGALDIETFRTWYLGELHNRLKKMPKNTRIEKTKKRIEYLLKVAELFDITPDKPFSGKFYFETII